MKILLLMTVFLLESSWVWAQKFEQLAQTPPMGWNSWNTFEGKINEQLIRQTADAMVANGMRNAGYNYIVIDDTWEAPERDAQGNLQADPNKFPSGMRSLGDYLHERGFKLGIYSCAGLKTCAGFPGSWGHEFQDARMFASWGVDFLKYDWCNAGSANAPDSYRRMRDALFAAGRPVVFSICEWGVTHPWEWAPEVGHLWRTTSDIFASYDGRRRWNLGWKEILDMQYSLVQSANGPEGLARYAGPGHWNDPDMLEVGNAGLSLSESRAHFSFWCLLAAPLMAGNDVRDVSPEFLVILNNAEAIAVDQDKLGKQGYCALKQPSRNREIWIKQLDAGGWAVCVLNTADHAEQITVDWLDLPLALRQKSLVRDLWSHQDLGDNLHPLTVKVSSHDVLFLRLRPVQ